MTTVTHVALERIRRRSLSWQLRRLLHGQETFASSGLDRLREVALPVEGPFLDAIEDAIEAVESGASDGRAEVIGGSRRTTVAARSLGSPAKTRAHRGQSLPPPARRASDDSPGGFPIWPRGSITPLRGNPLRRPTSKREADRADHLDGVEERIQVRRSAVALAGGATIVNPTSTIDRVGLRLLASSGRQFVGLEPRASAVPRSPSETRRTEARHPAAEPDRVYAEVNDRALLTNRRSSEPDEAVASSFGPAISRRPQNLAELVEWADHHDLDHHPASHHPASRQSANHDEVDGAIGLESHDAPTRTSVSLPTPNATVDRPAGRWSGDPTAPGPASELAWAADVVEAVLLREARMHGVTVDES
jgi:hypothetical protein